MAREKRSLKPDPQLLVDVIKRQAGSLWKAIVEGVMNSVDAGATTCDIELSREMLIIRDNGKGFRARKEIETYFERFGMKHEAREHKTFGAFRMGRGQLFAFGHNTWRSNKFAMTIDVDRDGLEYHLEDGLDRQDGCTVTVELYKPLNHTDYARMLDGVRNNCKYVSIVMTLNGKKCTADTSKIAWDLELPEADIVLRQNQDLRVYNQGVLVKAYYRRHYGIGGDVVTKQPLKVNFARNDIMDDCPLWAAIVKALQKHVNAQQTRTRPRSTSTDNTGQSQPRAEPVRLSEEDRERLCNQAKDGNLEAQQFKNAKLFQKWASSANFTVRQVANVARGKITITPEAGYVWKTRHRVEQIHMNALACVVARTTLKRFDLHDGPALVSLVNRVISDYDRYALTYVEWGDLCKVLTSECQIVQDEQLNRLESIVLGVLRQCSPCILRRIPHFASGPKRKTIRNLNIVVGRGPLNSWTDGSSYVAINRELIRRVKAGPASWMHYAHLIMHEAIHTSPTVAEHKHTKAFYQNYHDWMGTRWALGDFMYACTISTPIVAVSVRQRMPETELRNIDHVEAGANAAAAMGLIANMEHAEAEDAAT